MYSSPIRFVFGVLPCINSVILWHIYITRNRLDTTQGVPDLFANSRHPTSWVSCALCKFDRFIRATAALDLSLVARGSPLLKYNDVSLPVDPETVRLASYTLRQTKWNHPLGFIYTSVL
jgi:hypothetical protein